MGGHEVETCPSGQAALEVFGTFRPDVVLTDLNLDTSMSGIDLMRLLKEREPELPVILVTGQVSIQSAIDALREGAYDYITKPCDLEELGQLLGRALAARRLTETNKNLMRELTVANEILSRHESELRERIHVATWRMRTLFELSKEIAQDLGFESRSKLACEKARQLTGGSASALSPGTQLRRWCGPVGDGGAAADARAPRGQGLLRATRPAVPDRERPGRRAGRAAPG